MTAQRRHTSTVSSTAAPQQRHGAMVGPGVWIKPRSPQPAAGHRRYSGPASAIVHNRMAEAQHQLIGERCRREMQHRDAEAEQLRKDLLMSCERAPWSVVKELVS